MAAWIGSPLYWTKVLYTDRKRSSVYCNKVQYKDFSNSAGKVLGIWIVILLKNLKNASTRLSMNGKISNHFNYSSVRPEALEG
jgi:hypothetical protein